MRKREKYSFEDHVIFMTFAHFGSKVRPDDLSCVNCLDIAQGHCPGEGRTGLEVLSCMAGKVVNGEEIRFLQVNGN